MTDKCPMHGHPTPLGDDYYDDIHPVLADLNEQGPINRICVEDGIPVWLVTNYEAVRTGLWNQQLARPRKYAGPDYTNTSAPEGVPHARLVMEDPPEHTITRTLVNWAFTPRRVRDIQPRINEIVAQQIEVLEQLAEAGEPVDLMTTFINPQPLAVISGILGVPDQDVQHVMAAGDAAFGQEDNGNGEAKTELTRFMAGLVMARRENPTDDLISHWANARDENDELLEIRDILAMIFIVYIGGYDSTAGTMAASIVDLLENPDELARLIADPKEFDAVLDELLRRNSAVIRGVRRFATNDLDIAGQPVDQGDTVFLHIAAANRDPEVFEDPQKFDPARPSNSKHVAFGHGPHHCPGHMLAKTELLITLRELFTRFPTMKLAAAPAELKWRKNFVRTPGTLPVFLR